MLIQETPMENCDIHCLLLRTVRKDRKNYSERMFAAEKQVKELRAQIVKLDNTINRHLGIKCYD